jgi:hypothetical protein
MAENMPESNQFVWIRLVNNDVAAKVAVKKLEVVPGRAKLIYGGPRPPSNGSGVKSARAGNEGAAFLMDTRHAGLESSPTSFDLGPAFDDAQEARDWITQPAGQAWAEASVNYFLLAYAPAAGGLRRLHGADLEATPNPPVDRFPLDDWDPVLLESISAAGATGPAVLGQTITLGPASAYGSTDEAIRQQLRADARMRLTFKDDINFEAQGLDQVTYRMFQVVGLSTDHPVAIATMPGQSGHSIGLPSRAPDLELREVAALEAFDQHQVAVLQAATAGSPAAARRRRAVRASGPSARGPAAAPPGSRLRAGGRSPCPAGRSRSPCGCA